MSSTPGTNSLGTPLCQLSFFAWCTIYSSNYLLHHSSTLQSSSFKFLEIILCTVHYRPQVAFRTSPFLVAANLILVLSIFPIDFILHSIFHFIYVTFLYLQISHICICKSLTFFLLVVSLLSICFVCTCKFPHHVFSIVVIFHYNCLVIRK